MRKAIVVLGMHRSGTSALTGVIGKLGVALPQTLLDDAEENERGFWESAKMMTFQDQVMDRLGIFWDNPLPLPAGWPSAPEFADFVDGLVAVLEEEFGDAPLFVIKDPRTSRLIPMWLAALNRMQVQPRFLLCLRHPEEVARSLSRRNGIPRHHAYLLWLRHTIEPYLDTQNHPRCTVSYPALLEDWRGTVTRIGKELGIEWPRSVDDAAEEVDAYLSSDLRHHRDTDADSGLPTWVREVAAALDRGPALTTAEAEHLLDRVAEMIDSADHLYVPMVRELQEGRRLLLVTLAIQNLAPNRMVAHLRNLRARIAPDRSWLDRTIRKLRRRDPP